MTFKVSVHAVDHQYAQDSVEALRALGLEDVKFFVDASLDMAIRGLIDLPTYVATAGESLEADLYLYLDLEVKPTVKRFKERGLKPIPNLVQLTRLRYRTWADVGALQEKTFSLCPDKESLTVQDFKEILTRVIAEKRELQSDSSTKEET